MFRNIKKDIKINYNNLEMHNKCGVKLIKNIRISVLNIFAVILVCIGIYFFINGVIILDKLEHSSNLDSLSFNDIEEGRYVYAYISSVLGVTNEKGVFSAAVCYNLSTMEDEYTLPMGKQYITISVPQEYKTSFESITNAPVEPPLYILGKIVQYKSELRYETLKSCLNLNSRTEVDEKVSKFYYIKIVDEKLEKQVIMKGISLIITGFLLFFGFENPIRQYGNIKKQLNLLPETKQ